MSQNSQLLAADTVDVSFNSRFDKCLLFTFKGTLTQKDGHLAIQIWSEIFEGSDEKYTLIWNCSKMDGFERAARSEWTETLQKWPERIDKIFLISDSIIIRGAARLMLKLFHIELIPVKSESELSISHSV